MASGAGVLLAPAPGSGNVLAPTLVDRPWRAPLLPLALLVTGGVVLDRVFSLSLAASLSCTVLALLAWGATWRSSRRGLPLLYLALAAGSFGAAYHQCCRERLPADNVAYLLSENPAPLQVRGVLEDNFRPGAPSGMEEEGTPAVPLFATTLRVHHCWRREHWESASGRLRLSGRGTVAGLQAGDEVEVVGQGSLFPRAANPGERDAFEVWHDRGVAGRLWAPRLELATTRLESGRLSSWRGHLARIRSAGVDSLRTFLPEHEGNLAAALLLGDTHALEQSDWQKYARTGVIHVLVISGQHLVILGLFLRFLCELVGMRQRQAALVIALVLVGYALLVGFQPPVVRAVVTVCVLCGGLLLRRPSMTANSFALAWLIVLLLQPGDIFTLGCQLSFLAVAILYWGLPRVLTTPPEPEPLDRLIDATRPAWQRWGRRLGRQTLILYAINGMVWLALGPVLAARQHALPLIGLLIGPPVMALTSLALVGGFVQLLLGLIWAPLGWLPAGITRLSLMGCDGLVTVGNALPGASLIVGEVPLWWLAGFYGGVFAALWWPRRPTVRTVLVGGLGWLSLGLAITLVRWPQEGCRITFLAVGHGGCTVVEAPEGRVLMYDAGAMWRPHVARQQILPWLHARGIRRIDDLFLSHADADHYNGVLELSQMISIGQVSTNPSFAEKQDPRIAQTLGVLAERGVPVRTLNRGDRLSAGAVTLDVLHPPASGPPGPENVRSLVLLIQHEGHRVLLTGDLEGEGLAEVLALPIAPIDVLMAPHHGSRFPNTPELAQWCQPAVVLSSQGRPRSVGWKEPYSASGARYLTTWEEGAITVHLQPGGVVVEGYRSGQRHVVRKRAGPSGVPLLQ